MSARTAGALVAVALLALPVAAMAQGWRIHLDANAQAVSYRGWQMDSIAAGSVVTGPGGGPTTQIGRAHV